METEILSYPYQERDIVQIHQDLFYPDFLASILYYPLFYNFGDLISVCSCFVFAYFFGYILNMLFETLILIEKFSGIHMYLSRFSSLG